MSIKVMLADDHVLTNEHSKRFRLSWLIEPILMTLMPLSVHQELLNANPDFIEQ